MSHPLCFGIRSLHAETLELLHDRVGFRRRDQPVSRGYDDERGRVEIGEDVDG